MLPSIRSGIRTAAGGFGGQGQLAARGAMGFELKGKDVFTQQLDTLKIIANNTGPGSRIPAQGALTPAGS